MTIGNRFYVTALEDGTTLHGNLTADQSLTQAWNGTGCIPNWNPSGPKISLTLLSGSSAVQPDSNYKWYYNDVEITWVSTAANAKSTDGRFQKVPNYPLSNPMPTIQIIDNLASNDNVDMDVIKFVGSYTIGGAGVSFSATAQIRISRITAGSNLGVISFADGKSDITEAGGEITMTGVLYGADGNVFSEAYTTQWYLNDQQIVALDSHSCKVTEGQVVDHAIISCRFYTGSGADQRLVYTAYAAIDDVQDTEYMYIQYNGANGNAASLRQGDTAAFSIWVGTRDSAEVKMKGLNPEYPYIYVKLLDGNGDIILTDGLTIAIPDVTAANKVATSPLYGYRLLTMSGGKASISPSYATVYDAGKKNLTGIVIAYSENPEANS